MFICHLKLQPSLFTVSYNLSFAILGEIGLTDKEGEADEKRQKNEAKEGGGEIDAP